MTDKKGVSGDEAITRMLKRGLGQKGESSGKEEPSGDPIKEAQQFSKQMAANALIESEIAKANAATRKAEAEATKAEAEAARAAGGGGVEQKSPIDISGSLKLGNIDYGKMIEDAARERDELRKEAEAQARQQAGISDDLRERLHNKEIEVLKVTFESQMNTLTRMIESNASKGSFADQLNATKEMAGLLGFQQGSTGGNDLLATIELKKMEFENVRELRKMAREEKRADREFQLELKKYDEERESRRAESVRLAKKDEFWAAAPEMVGRAIVRGMQESGAEGVSGTPERSRGTGGGTHIEVGEGESGTIPCPNCAQIISIGPTASKGVCAGCGLSLPVTRVSAEEMAEENRDSGLRSTY